MAQLTIFETVKSGIERVGSVVAGVLVAVALSNFVGLTWWSLGIAIFAALVIGTVLHLGDHTLEVPISAMLVLAVAGQTGTAALSRVVETLIGAVTGVVVSFMLRPPVYVQPAGDAIGELASEMAELLSSMGEELTEGWSGEQARAWEDRARELDRPLRAARIALARGEESLRLNPRQRRVREGASSLRAALATLEHAAVQVRGITLDLADLAEAVEATDQAEPELLVALGRLLVELGGGVAAFGQLVAPEVAGPPREAVPLHIALEIARTHRDVLAELMLVDARDRPGAVAHPGQPAGQRRPAAARDRPGAGPGRPARAPPLSGDNTGRAATWAAGKERLDGRPPDHRRRARAAHPRGPARAPGAAAKGWSGSTSRGSTPRRPGCWPRCSGSTRWPSRTARTATTCPRCTSTPTTCSLALHSPELGKGGHVHHLELDQFVGPGYLVTVHGPLDPEVIPGLAFRETSAVLKRVKAGRFRPASSFELSHAIVSAMTRHQEEFLGILALEVGLLEQRVMGEEHEDPEQFLEELFRARHGLIAVKTMAALSREIYGRMATLTRFVPADAQPLVGRHRRPVRSGSRAWPTGRRSSSRR